MLERLSIRFFKGFLQIMHKFSAPAPPELGSHSTDRAAGLGRGLEDCEEDQGVQNMSRPH